VNRNASFVSREAYLVDDEPRMVFLTRYEQRFTNDDVLGYCSMRLFALSIRPLWHGVCVPTSIMGQGRTTFGAVIAVAVILIFPHQVPAQQSTAPPSSLSTRPLTPWHTESELRPSCDLCRKPDARAGSDIKPNRLRREKGLRPHKNAKGTHRSLDQSLKSTLPRHPLAPPEGQGRQNSQTREPAE
jgi:hypothetical protein